MKIIAIILGLGFTAQVHAWSCSITTYDDPSSVDRCFGRILDHWLHDSKAQIVYQWKTAREEYGGTLDKAGDIWSTDSVQNSLIKLERLRDAKDWLSRDKKYQDIELTCSTSSSSS